MLINELVTNTVKYAYPKGDGEVRVSIGQEKAGHLRMEVSDSGVGLPVDFHALGPTSLGRKLIASLAHQLGGKPQWQDAQPAPASCSTSSRTQSQQKARAVA